jgi:hypothetical protein
LPIFQRLHTIVLSLMASYFFQDYTQRNPPAERGKVMVR